MRGGRDDLQTHFCKSPLSPPMSPPLDQHRVAPIEVFIVCTEGLAPDTFPSFILINVIYFKTDILQNGSTSAVITFILACYFQNDAGT
jgi:hypothetical protein